MIHAVFLWSDNFDLDTLVIDKKAPKDFNLGGKSDKKIGSVIFDVILY